VTDFLLEHVDIEINHRCNLACRHCSARPVNRRSTDELSIEEIKEILTKAKALGLHKVGLTGGEPLFDVGKLEEISRFCVGNLSVPIHTHTNGTLIVNEVCQPGGVLALFESISVTFLGGNSDTHDHMTAVRGSFEKTFRGAVTVSRAGLPLTCYFIPTHGTCSGFRKLAEELWRIGVTKIRAMALAPSGRARPIYGQAAPLEEELNQFGNDLLEISGRLGIYVEAGNCTRLSMPRLGILEGHDRCMSGINRVHINSKGEVFPCTAASGVKELTIGNLRKNGMNLKDLWFKSDLIKKIRCLHEGKLPVCEKCTREPKCKSTCMVNACGTMSETERENCPLVSGHA
jgi:radical SAM protein with 4Fe4S-binding SPASM domain